MRGVLPPARVTVLVVADSKSRRLRTVLRIASAKQVSVVSTPPGKVAMMCLVTTLRPDCVVVCIDEGNDDDFTSIAAIRGIDWECRIIVVAESATAEFRRRCLAIGVNEFPTTSSELESLIESAVSRGELTT